jgi:2-methylisocitrate lyase-like PEP mutase family enzyme
MKSTDTEAIALAFHRLHDGPEPLVLVNAWDAVSARVIERAGARAIGTSSAAMAWALGHSDGEQLPVPELIAACARIRRVTALPVSVDIERGYGRDTRAVRELGSALIDLGVVGVNIEDGVAPDTHRLAAPEPWCERIAALRDVARAKGVPSFFINARSDTYFTPFDDPGERFAETLRRARLAIEAGANGVFVPGMDRIDDIARITRELPRPLNVYAGYAGVPPVAELARAGVHRVSLGCGPLQSALGLLQRLTTEALNDGRYDTQCAGMLSAREVNGLFALGGAAG